MIPKKLCPVSAPAGATMRVVTADNELLRLFVTDGSESAFAELVHRHLGMVYSTALRKLGGDAALAEDMAQQVFTDLSRKARTLVTHPCLASWLYKATCFAAAKAVRREQRQRARVQATSTLMQTNVQQEESPNWDTLSQHLDEAMNDLAEADREAVLLRYFQDRNFRQVGLQLGLSEEAARKRVERAIEKLRMAFSRRGVQTSSAAMAAAIAGQSLIPIPHALGAVICQTAAASASSQAIGAITLMTKLKTGLVAASLIAAVTTTIIEYRANLRLRNEIAQLQGQLADQQAFVKSSDATGKPDGSRKVLPVGADQRELLRLRAEVTRLRRSLIDLNASVGTAQEKDALRRRLGGTDLQIESQPGKPFAPHHYYPKELWADVGLDSPEATLQTALWAAKSGAVSRVVEAMNLSQEQKQIFLSRWTSESLNQFPGVSAIGIKIESFGGTLESSRIDYIGILDEGEGQPPKRAHFYVDNVEGNWRLAPNISIEGDADQYLLAK